MTKQELIDDLRNQQIGLTKAEIERVLDALGPTIARRVGAGESVRIPGFGTWSAKPTAERPGRNPQTGESITIKAGIRLHFSPATDFEGTAKGIAAAKAVTA